MTIREIADQFQLVDPQDRLDILLDYSERLPPLPEAYAPLRDRGLNMVHECQSPVFLMVEVDDDDVVHLHADVPREAPTARSFTSILLEAFDEQPASVVLDAPQPCWPAASQPAYRYLPVPWSHGRGQDRACESIGRIPVR